MTNQVFLSAFHELTFMGPIAFVLDFFIVSKLAFACANRMVDFRSCHPFSMILAISVASVAFMCPMMSFFATLFFKHAGNQFIAIWLQTTFMNFPVAFFWQLIYAGPIVRFIFRHIFPEKENAKEAAKKGVEKSEEELYIWQKNQENNSNAEDDDKNQDGDSSDTSIIDNIKNALGGLFNF